MIEFIIKANISLSVVYTFYRLVLRPMTFYKWNRWYLFCYPVLSFIIPFIDISKFVPGAAIMNVATLQRIPVLVSPSITVDGGSAMEINHQVFLIIFLTGVVVLLTRFFTQLNSYLTLRKTSRLISGSPTKIYAVDQNIVPFSFGNSIFINALRHNEEEFEKIIQHEFVHVKQKHTADIIFGEVLCILNWYNPFAWLLKRSIRQNLEFIVDE